MKVSELIVKLQALNGDDEVVITSAETQDENASALERVVRTYIVEGGTSVRRVVSLVAKEYRPNTEYEIV